MRVKPDFISLEAPTPLADSKLWSFQQDFYRREGIGAWGGKVPYYITSNPYIANSYAQIMVRFMQDYARSGRHDPTEPFYILELGAGSGTFSFYALRRLMELREQLGLTHLAFRYVMTDVTPKNIDYWRQHERFQPYLRQRVLDFAQYDVLRDTHLRLMLEGRVLDSHQARVRNPIIILANYIFDSLPQDLFYIDQGLTREGLVTLSTHKDNVKDGVPARLDQVEITFAYRDAARPYYTHPPFEAVLDSIRDTTPQGFVLVPSGTFRSLERLITLADGRLCLITSDKGFSRHDTYYQQREPLVAFHDNCFSLNVNYAMLKAYFSHAGGESYHQFAEQDLSTSVFLLGASFRDLPEMRQAMETFLDGFGHSTVFQLYQQMARAAKPLNLDTLIPFLNSTRWDPHLLHWLLPKIIRQVRSGTVQATVLEDLRAMMDKFADHYYHLPGSYDLMFDIGKLLQEMRDYRKALRYYERSFQYSGEQEGTFYNVGLCHHFLHEPRQALEAFGRVVALNPGHIMARGWISQIEYELSCDADNGRAHQIHPSKVSHDTRTV